MISIYSTQIPHYVCCINPIERDSENTKADDSKQLLFHRNTVALQLRYAGILEAVKMARLSFPNRYTHQVFYQRYRILSNPNHPVSKQLPLTLSPSLTPSEAQAQCDLLIQTLNKTSGELSASPSSSAVDPHLQEEQVTGALAVVATLQSNLLELGSRYVSIAKILSKIGLYLLAISYHRHHLVHIMFRKLTYIILIATSSSSSSSLSGGVTRKNTVVSGLSKVFLDKNAHSLLEAYRFHLLTLCTNKIGGLIMRKVILKKRSTRRQVAAVMTQRLVRGFIARRRYKKV